LCANAHDRQQIHQSPRFLPIDRSNEGIDLRQRVIQDAGVGMPGIN